MIFQNVDIFIVFHKKVIHGIVGLCLQLFIIYLRWCIIFNLHTVANTNGEDWAAKARAWAAAKVASDSQQTQPPSYAVKEGSLAGESVAVYPGRDSSISPSVHQQEVPSSYSSITGKKTANILLLHVKLQELLPHIASSTENYTLFVYFLIFF